MKNESLWPYGIQIKVWHSEKKEKMSERRIVRKMDTRIFLKMMSVLPRFRYCHSLGLLTSDSNSEHSHRDTLECFRKHDFAPLLLSPALKITIPARCSIHVVRKPCEKVFAKTLYWHITRDMWHILTSSTVIQWSLRQVLTFRNIFLKMLQQSSKEVRNTIKFEEFLLYFPFPRHLFKASHCCVGTCVRTPCLNLVTLRPTLSPNCPRTYGHELFILLICIVAVTTKRLFLSKEILKRTAQNYEY